jgi:asparagine synthase (glutamine-hydrolysing)
LLGRDGAERALRTRIALLGRSLTAGEADAYGDSVLTFGATRRERLLGAPMRAELGGWRAEELLENAWTAAAADGVDRPLAVDTETYLPGDLLTKVDIATMAYSVEARSPFLDHRLLEFAAGLPGELKLGHGGGKQVLKAAMRGILPDAILERPKMGFGVPLKHWYRGELAELPGELLLDPDARCREYLDGAEIERLLAEHADGSYDHATRIWVLMQLETWHREVLEPARSAARPVR